MNFQPQRDARVFVQEALQCRNQIMSGKLRRGGDAQFPGQFTAQRGNTLLPAFGGMDHQHAILIKTQPGLGQAQ
ncbi:hypothetical protein D3C80_1947740 [compost metagenome]